MELYAKGQLSYLILTCMQERDFYGLDIISEISNRSNGRINLKKPSVYSNLTRMEKQGYISSYLQNSDYGPNRKYYSLTEKGRGFYNELKSYFENNNIDVFRDFQDVEGKDSQEIIQTKNEENEDSNSDDFFDFSSLNKEDSPAIQQSEQIEVINENSGNDFSDEIQPSEDKKIVEEAEEVKEEAVKDDAVFLSNENINEYNKRLYDISKDINKIKRKRSFADDQIAMTATAPLLQSDEKVKTSIQNFKSSLIENREKYQEKRTESFNYFKQKEENKTVVKTEEIVKNEPVKDDAKFITNRIDASLVEHARKIEPPKLKIVSENTKDIRLPAPNRDKTIDPSHREILNKLYSRTKDGSSAEVRADAIYDYNDLKDYYKSQQISFTVYQKPTNKSKHNTNKLYLINSIITFLLSAVCSTTLYLVFNHIGFTNPQTNFLYILLPALIIIDVVFRFYNYKNYSGWIPSQIKPQWQMWLCYLLSSILVAGINFAFGMATKSFALFATSLILPLIMLLIMLPVRYYLKRLLLVKFWR